MKYPGSVASIALLSLACSISETPDRRMVTQIDLPAAAGSMAPNLMIHDSSVFITWLEPGDGDHKVRFSSLDENGVWSQPGTVSQSSDFFVNWADFPSVQIADSGTLYAHWLQKSGAGTYAYDVRLGRSDDGGTTWTEMGTAHDDGTQTEHGFASMVPEEDGVRIFWLDGREMKSDTEAASDGHHAGGSMTLRTALLDEGIERSEVLDKRTCECCQTGAAATPDGTIVVYRDRSESEVRDIWYVRQQGDGWTEPQPVHVDGWVVPGCPVNGPSIAAGGHDGRQVAVAWFTAPDNLPRVQVAFSSDAGASFGKPVVLDSETPVGRVDVELDESGDAVVSWLANVGEKSAAIRVARVVQTPSSVPDSALSGTPLTLAMTEGSRASGFPRMVRRGDDLVFAWTDSAEGTGVKTAVVPIEGVPVFSHRSVAAHDSAPKAGPDPATVSAPAPDYTATDLEGGTVSLSDLRGQPVLLNFWATWCLPCREEIPVLVQVHERYSERGLRLVGVSLDDAPSLETVKAFVREHDVPYMNVHDPANEASRLFGLTILPGSVLIDSEGKIVWSRSGVIHQNDAGLQQALETLFPAGDLAYFSFSRFRAAELMQ